MMGWMDSILYYVTHGFNVFDIQILSTTHVLAAVFRAANDYLSGRLKSRNVHSEIVFSLGGNNNVCLFSLPLSPGLL